MRFIALTLLRGSATAAFVLLPMSLIVGLRRLHCARVFPQNNMIVYLVNCGGRNSRPELPCRCFQNNQELRALSGDKESTESMYLETAMTGHQKRFKLGPSNIVTTYWHLGGTINLCVRSRYWYSVLLPHGCKLLLILCIGGLGVSQTRG